LRNQSVYYYYCFLANTILIVILIFVLLAAKLAKYNLVTRKASQIRLLKSMPRTFLMCPHLQSCIWLIAVFQRDRTRKGTGKENRERLKSCRPFIGSTKWKKLGEKGSDVHNNECHGESD